LHHTSGLRDYIELLLLGGAHLDGVTDARDALDTLARQRALEFPPGTRHAYSNSGYFLLAQVVERVTGKPFAAFVAERLFAPLGMTRSHVHDDHTRIVPGRAIGYAPRPGGGWRIEMSGWEQTGDGAVMTTVRDLARWDANFYDPRVGGQDLLDGLHRKGRLSSGEEIDYASGLVHGVHRGLATVSHAGEWAGYRAQLLRFPAQRTSLIVLCNTNEIDPSGVAYAIAEVVLEDELAPVPAAGGAAAPPVLSPAELDLWAGSYRETGSGALMRVAREGDALVIGAGGQRLQLLPAGRSSFVLGSPPDQVVLAFEGSAPARRIRVSGEGVSESYAEARPPAPGADGLSALAGRYRSSELAAEWTLSLEAGRLIARAGALEGELEPSAPDEFALQPLGVVVAFHRDEETVTGFELRGRRLGGIHFERLTAK
jgi:CubicO group peptidase (beta-lactamase class C family)